MKQVKLIETGIIAVVLVLLYQFVISFIAFIAGIFFMVSNDMPDTGSSIILDMTFPLVLYLCSIYLLVMNKKKLARLINGKGEDENHLPINFSGRQLLYSTIIIVCLIAFINEIPVIASWVIENLTNRTNNTDSENSYTIDRKIRLADLYGTIFKVLLTVVFAFLAKRIANLFSNQQDNPAN